MLADELEITRLKDMGVLIPAESFDFGGETRNLCMVNMCGCDVPGTWPEHSHGPLQTEFCADREVVVNLVHEMEVKTMS